MITVLYTYNEQRKTKHFSAEKLAGTVAELLGQPCSGQICSPIFSSSLKTFINHTDQIVDYFYFLIKQNFDKILRK